MYVHVLYWTCMMLSGLKYRITSVNWYFYIAWIGLKGDASELETLLLFVHLGFICHLISFIVSTISAEIVCIRRMILWSVVFNHVPHLTGHVRTVLTCCWVKWCFLHWMKRLKGYCLMNTSKPWQILMYLNFMLLNSFRF